MIQYDMTLGHDTIPQQAEISPQLYLFEIATPIQLLRVGSPRPGAGGGR